MHKKILGIWLVLALVLSMAAPQYAEAKQIQVKALKGNTMRVGQTKTVKANQVVTWRSLNKKLTITSKKKAKKVTIRAKKKGTGILEAKRGKATARIRIKVKKKLTEQSNENLDDDNLAYVSRNETFYIIEIIEDKVKLATERDGMFIAYVRIEDNTKIMKDSQIVSKADLQIGQCVVVTFKNNEDMIGGRLWDCTAITIIEE